MRVPAVAVVLGLLSAAAPASAGGVTLSNPEKVKVRKQGITRVAGGSPKTKARGAGEVMFSVKNADLKTVVLPMFKDQVGVSINYRGAPRKVTMRLTQPMAWEQALELVAQFTSTHLARGHRSQFMLKERWGGKVDEKQPFDDLRGQVETPHSLKASVRRKKIPVTRPGRTGRMVTVRLGGGTIRLGPSGSAPRPYVSPVRAPKPYVSPVRAPKPYVSPTRAPKSYVSRNSSPRPYVSPVRTPKPYVSPTRAPRPYVSPTRAPKPYVSPNRPALEYRAR